jgi:hypothetical protein
MYREWKEIEFPKQFVYEFGNNKTIEVDQEIDVKMKRGRMEEQLVEKSGRKKYITERNGRSY